MVTKFNDYTTNNVYKAVPQFIQDNDTNNNSGTLRSFIKSVGLIVDTINSYSRDSIGVDGNLDMENYAGAPGWSQVVDIDRAPSETLPWLGQFVGVRINPADQATSAQKINKIKKHSSFQRGTLGALTSALAAAINKSLPTAQQISTKQIIVLEQTQYVNGGYSHDDYSMTILIPVAAYSLFTYQQLETMFDVYTDGTLTYRSKYSDVEAYVQSLASGQYAGLRPNITPSTNSKIVTYINRYRPAGMQIYIGGY